MHSIRDSSSTTVASSTSTSSTGFTSTSTASTRITSSARITRSARGTRSASSASSALAVPVALVTRISGLARPAPTRLSLEVRLRSYLAPTCVPNRPSMGRFFSDLFSFLFRLSWETSRPHN